MSLVAGHGPLGRQPAGWFTPPLPGPVVYIEPHPRRIQAFVGGDARIDTEHAVLVHRAGHALSYAFPHEEVVGLPSHPVAEAPGYVAVPWDAVDAWFEEGRRLVHYPPNPYHRIDCLQTSRRLRVTVEQTVLVDTADTVILFETALAPRLYVNPALVRMDLLHRSQSISYCNYKGTADYWSVALGATVIADVAWSYSDPPPESLPIKGFLSFDTTKVQVLAELPGSGDATACGCEF
ncbi:hypothetical protein A5784_30465 [Mycobacterium sp. 852013-50091_SCH5140682]|uniref:DUF427 domain-containing protein n=1 Tax=Mycobacterium sp. 852013-50091_SCH5140682 TaxID=1834109 RepID=UPI0007EC104E|nr:DUF427 domain-containing protein [Mycobacterium sp. 852013-50091_SCH5140682]OBC14299.1 hypothetical protein A5784_30465 [Mycobacterium sp. 852013-50091_SCH5140682]